MWSGDSEHTWLGLSLREDEVLGLTRRWPMTLLCFGGHTLCPMPWWAHCECGRWLCRNNPRWKSDESHLGSLQSRTIEGSGVPPCKGVGKWGKAVSRWEAVGKHNGTLAHEYFPVAGMGLLEDNLAGFISNQLLFPSISCTWLRLYGQHWYKSISVLKWW